MSRHPYKLAVLAVTAASLAGAFTTTSYQHSVSSLPPFRPKSAQHASVETRNGRQINGEINGVHSELEPENNQGRTISPYHILHPEQFGISSSEILKREANLHTCLQLLRQVLTVISSGDAILPENTNVLRIEHAISHNIDPLCWLQAQKESISELPSTFYFASAEGTFEVASYGWSKLFHGTTSDDTFWELVQKLPHESHFYGGQRFDVSTEPSKVANEWSRFSTGFWMLSSRWVSISVARTDREEKLSAKYTLQYRFVQKYVLQFIHEM